MVPQETESQEIQAGIQGLDSYDNVPEDLTVPNKHRFLYTNKLINVNCHGRTIIDCT